MSELNRLDNISNMSDEELDAFIKSELNSSLMEDIKVDEELINKTLKAAYYTDAQVDSEIHSNEITFNNKKTGSRLRRYIPVLSMAACACIIVMAGSLIYSKLDMKKGEKVDNNKSHSMVEESVKDETSSNVDGQEQNNTILNNQSGIQSDQKYDEDLNADSDGFLNEDTAPESDQENIEDSTVDKNEQIEEPEAIPDEPLEGTPSTDVIYEVSKILKIKDDNNNYLSMDVIESGDATAILYDEVGIELGQEEFLNCIKDIYEKSENDMVNTIKLTFDERLIAGFEHLYINMESREYYILLDVEEGIDEINIAVMEKQ